MAMPMMQIRIVRVFVPHRIVAVPMGMRLCHRPVMLMLMLMMVVMAVGVVVLHRVMAVLMVMPFSQMQPQPNRHQQP